MEHIIEYLQSQYKKKSGNVLEITTTQDNRVFPISTHSLSWVSAETIMKSTDQFDFSFIYHTLEKTQNPNTILTLLKNNSTCGYIETTSPLLECLDRLSVTNNTEINRYIIWSSEEGILHILPKYSFMHKLNIDSKFEKEMKELLDTYPHYKNNYYTWNPEQPIKYILYQHGINFDVYKDYTKLLESGIQQSINYSNIFLNRINNKDNINKLDDTLSTPLETKCE